MEAMGYSYRQSNNRICWYRLMVNIPWVPKEGFITKSGCYEVDLPCALRGRRTSRRGDTTGPACQRQQQEQLLARGRIKKQDTLFVQNGQRCSFNSAVLVLITAVVTWLEKICRFTRNSFFFQT